MKNLRINLYQLQSKLELFEWFKIDQAEFDKKFMEDPDAEDKLEK